MSRLVHLLGAGSVLALGLAMPSAFGQVADDEAYRTDECHITDWDAEREDVLDAARRDGLLDWEYVVVTLGLPCGMLPAVIVTGDRPSSEPGSLSRVSAANVRDTLADHPAEILNSMPGVNIHTNSGQEHLIAIRSPVLNGGAGQGSFLVLQNGVPTRSPAFGNVNMLLETHHEIAWQIEVVRGPASAGYGSNAVHGLVDIIMPTLGTETEVSVSSSTLSRSRGDFITNSGSVIFGLSLQHDEGWRDDTGLDQQKLYLASEIEIGGWTGQAWLSAMNLNQETGGFVQGPNAYEDEALSEANANPEAFRDAQFAMAAIELGRSFGDYNVNVTPYARWQDMEFRQHFLPYKGYEENSHSAFGVMGDVTRSHEDLRWTVGGMVDAASGDLLETQPAPFGFFPGDSRFPVGVHYDYTVDTLALALWGELEYEISDDIRVLAGLRAETHDYDYTTRAPAGINGRFNVPANRSDSFDLVTPKLGIIWDDAIGNVALYANYARGQRAPQASDLYRLQNLQTVGEVKSETLDSFEIGARGAVLDGRLYFDVAGYVMEKENFFFRDAQGLNVIAGRTDHAGIEVQASFELTDTVTVSGNLSWADHTYAFDRAANGIVDGNQIDSAPEWLGDLRIAWAPTERFDAGLSLEYVGEYFTNEANTASYDGHTVASARASYDLTDQLEVFVIIRNLTDERYADRADFAFGNDRYFPGEPMNATFGVRASFD